MSLWLVRAGKEGEHEEKFLSEGRIYLTWSNFTQDISKVADKKSLYSVLDKVFPDNTVHRIRNWGAQIWPIANDMQIGDWIALPSKKDSVIHFGEITGEYINSPQGENPYYHYRNVNWFAKNIPRTTFEQDILSSLGALPTICRIKRNDSENRIKEIAANNWNLKQTTAVTSKTPASKNIQNINMENSISSTSSDFEQLGRQQIVSFLIQKFSGSKLTDLVNEILKAKKYSTTITPEQDGINILASEQNKEHTKICVHIKEAGSEVNRLSLYQLMGAMQNFNADKGLLVSWDDITLNVNEEVPNQAFRLKIWNKNTLINELIDCYDNLSDEMKTQIPLKRTWTLALVS